MLPELLLLLLTMGLGDEVAGFLEEYSFQGYTRQWSRALYLELEEPCTLWVFSPGNLQGVVCAAGGDSVLNLRMELSTPDVNITDGYPNDLPVLHYETGQSGALTMIVVEVSDILFGASADSVYVYSAMREVPSILEVTTPAQPDSAIPGE